MTTGSDDISRGALQANIIARDALPPQVMAWHLHYARCSRNSLIEVKICDFHHTRGEYSMTAPAETPMAANMKTSEMICVAAVAGAFGIKGEVKLKAFTDVPENCVSYGPLLSEAGRVILTPSSHRLVKDAVAIRCAEVTTREQAEALKSTKLYVPRENFPAPEEDEFYASDLVGLDVKTTDGKRMGKVIDVQDFGAGDLLEIKPKDSASFFHPFTLAAVPKVDITAGRVVIKVEEAE